MKKLLLYIISLLIVPSIFPQQYYYTFSELKGMEDNSGNTHLFYRLYTYQKGGEIVGDYQENSIYHLDIGNSADSLFLFDGGKVAESATSITDYEFWNNDPTWFIYGGVYTAVDPTAFIKRYDKEEELITFFGGDDCNIELSNKNDSLVFATINFNTIKSINKGETWDTIPSMFGKEIISLNPLNDSIIFAQTENQLLKSIDGGNNFSVVDTFKTDIKQFYYDEDETHIYRLINYQGNYFLSVSNNKGEPFSWTQKYNSSNKILISIDNSQSGSIYLSDRNYIYYSNDYGENFSLFKKLERKIVGIYKKPNSNKLYAATKYDLYEITPDSIKTLKHLQIDPDIFSWFPLHVGDKWVYHEHIDQTDPFMSDTDRDWTKVVTGKVIKENGKEYFEYSYTNYFPYYSNAENLERIDTSSGKVYRFTSDILNYPEKEYAVIDLLAEIEDTVNSYYYYYSKAWLNFEGNLTEWNILSTYKHFIEFESLAGYNYDLVSNFGIDNINYGFDFGGSISQLKGAVINGIVYGDTTITDIKKSENIPTSFSLSQNYPNPFNPATKIKYSIPAVETHRDASLLVTLRVYDILGREILTLVNKEQSPGNYEIEFSGHELPSGIYFYKLSARDFHQTKKMILLK